MKAEERKKKGGVEKSEKESLRGKGEENNRKRKHTTRTVLCNSSRLYACMHIKHSLIHTSRSIR